MLRHTLLALLLAPSAAFLLVAATPSPNAAAAVSRASLVKLRGGQELVDTEATRDAEVHFVVPTGPGVVEYSAGPPVASLVPPGECVFDEEWAPAPLLKREFIGHDTLLLTFGLQDSQRPLGLSTCACLLARGPALSADGEAIVRPYTPVSTNEMRGAFQIMVKVYPEGAMSQQLARLPVGASVDFKHIKFNVKLQYPFRAHHVVMLVGGTGIAPMLQALHALLGTPNDRSQTTLLYSSKAQEDILARGTLDAWEAAHPDRLKVRHTLTREPEGTGWTGRRSS